MEEQTLPQFTLPGATEDLVRICRERIRDLYGATPPSLVLERFEQELAMLEGTNHSSVFMLLHGLTKHLHQKGHRNGMRGTFGSVFISFLLEITEENPLPAHYHCPHCKSVRWMSEVVSGYDLPTEICPHCGRERLGDGHNLPYEFCLGFRPGDGNPYVEMHLPSEAQEMAVAYLVDLVGVDRIALAGEWNNPVCFMLLPDGMEFEDVTPMVTVDPPVYGITKKTVTPGYQLSDVLQRVLLLPLDHFDFTRQLHQLTHTKPEDIRYNDSKVLGLFQNLDTLGITEFSDGMGKAILERLDQVCFSDLVRINGLVHSTGLDQENIGNLIDRHPFEELIGDRTDIFLTLQKYGIPPKKAFQVAETVRKGKFSVPSEKSAQLEKELQDYGVPQWYIDSMKRITYLFCKAHLITSVKLFFTLAWFKCYYPEQYYRVKLQQLNADDFLQDSTEELQQIAEEYLQDGDEPPLELLLLLEARQRNIPIDL